LIDADNSVLVIAIYRRKKSR